MIMTPRDDGTSSSNSSSSSTIGIEAASIHVQAGHFDDTLPGLARTYHFLLSCGEGGSMSNFVVVVLCIGYHVVVTNIILRFSPV
jgi:hypothetical protein